MKKFVSAVTAAAAVASAVAAALPASVWASKVVDNKLVYTQDQLDASKTLYLSTLTDDYHADKSEITVTADDLKNGDLTIKCGMFYDSATIKQVNAIQARFGLKEGNASSIELALPKGANGQDIMKSFFTSNQTFTTKSGEEFTTKCLPHFAGLLDDGDYESHGTMAAFYFDNDESVGIDKPFISVAWGYAYGDYSWVGDTSDEYPAYYFDVTIKSDAETGDYVFDFIDYYTDAPKNMLRATYLGSTVTGYEYYSEEANKDMNEGLLNFKPLTIHVENGDVVSTGENTNPSVGKTEDPTKENTTTGSVSTDGAVFKFDQDVYEVQPGDVVKVSLYLDTKGQLLSGAELAVAISGDMVGSVTSVKGSCKSCDASYLTQTYTDFVDSFGEGKLLSDYSTDGTIWSVSAAAPIGTLNDDNSYTSVASTNDDYFMQFTVTVPDDAEGTYTMSMPYFFLAGNKTAGNVDPEAPVTAQGAKAIFMVGDVEPTTEEPTTAAPTTAAPTTAAPTTAAPTTAAPTTAAPTTGEQTGVSQGTRRLGDSNVDGNVNVADVVILNRYLAGQTDILEDQGKINAEVETPTTDVTKVKLDYKDSQYILKSIIHLYNLTDNGPVATGDKGTVEVK